MEGGGYQHPSLTELLTFNTNAIVGNITNIGVGYGADLGTQLIYKVSKKFTFMSGLALTDIGNTAFASPSAPIQSNLTFGIAGRYINGDMIATLAYDYTHITDYRDWKTKTHMGLELKFPILSLSIGLSQFYLCYGAGIDIGIFKIMYLSYTEELSSIQGLNGERRNMVHFSMNFSL